MLALRVYYIIYVKNSIGRFLYSQLAMAIDSSNLIGLLIAFGDSCRPLPVYMSIVWILFLDRVSNLSDTISHHFG